MQSPVGSAFDTGEDHAVRLGLADNPVGYRDSPDSSAAMQADEAGPGFVERESVADQRLVLVGHSLQAFALSAGCQGEPEAGMATPDCSSESGFGTDSGNCWRRRGEVVLHRV